MRAMRTARLGHNLSLHPLFPRQDSQLDVVLSSRHESVDDDQRLVCLVVDTDEKELPRGAVHLYRESIGHDLMRGGGRQRHGAIICVVVLAVEDERKICLGGERREDEGCGDGGDLANGEGEAGMPWTDRVPFRHVCLTCHRRRTSQ